MNQLRHPRLLIATAVGGIALLGGMIGAGTYAAFSNSQETTVVRPIGAPTTMTASGSKLTINEIYRQAHEGVVEITATGQGGGDGSLFGGAAPTQRATGSGFVYDSKGHIVTNQHVVAGASTVTVKLANGKNYDAKIVGTDTSTDVAVLKINASSSDLHPLRLGDSSKVNVGDSVIAIGNPFGLADSVTDGIVSAIHRDVSSPNHFPIRDAIQTNAAINHGNSGGVLLDAEGLVIGVTEQIASDNGGNEGVGFALPINAVSGTAKQLISTGKVDHAYLGAQVTTANSGALIIALPVNSPAAATDLQRGDTVTAIDGKTIKSGSELTAAIDAKRPGDSVTLTVSRSGGGKKEIKVRLGVRPN